MPHSKFQATKASRYRFLLVAGDVRSKIYVRTFVRSRTPRQTLSLRLKSKKVAEKQGESGTPRDVHLRPAERLCSIYTGPSTLAVCGRSVSGQDRERRLDPRQKKNRTLAR